jgi:hypothetical protein
MRPVKVGEPISQQTIEDLRAMSKRSDDTGELWSYDPATRKAEVYAPAKRSSQVVQVVDIALLRLSKTVVLAPPRRQNLASGRERRPSTRRTSRTSRGSPDGSEPEPPPVEHWRGIAAASVRMHTRLARRRAKQALA